MRRLPLHRRTLNRELLLAGMLSLVPPLGTPPTRAPGATDRDLFQGDARLRKSIAVRMSRMPVADLLHRLDAELGVSLGAEGEDVAEQKIDLRRTRS